MKRILICALCIMCILVLSPVARAETQNILDSANILSSQEEAVLNNTAQEIAKRHDISVAIRIVDSLNGVPTWEYADQYFYSGSFGDDGILLLISMEHRDWEIATYGHGADRISDRECDNLFDAMATELSCGEYFKAFDNYLSALDMVLSRRSYGENPALQFGVSLAIGVVVALIAILVMRGRMKTAKPQSNAGNYLKDGSYRLTESSDIYLYSNISKTPRPKNTYSDGGGGSRGGSRGKF